MSSKKLIIIVILTLAISADFVQSEPDLRDWLRSDKILPVKETIWEKIYFQRDLSIQYNLFSEIPEGIYTPEAEFDSYYGVLVQWPAFGGPQEDIFEYFTAMVVEIAEAAKVFMVVSTEIEREYLLEHLIQKGVDSDQLIFFIFNNDSFWARDFGPQYIFDEEGNATIIDLLYYPGRYFDDIIPRQFETSTNLPRYTLPLYFEGGNLMSDGVNTCSYNYLLYYENYNYTEEEIDDMMRDYCGCERSIKLPVDYDYVFFHIDLAAKFITKNKVLVAELPLEDNYHDFLEEIAGKFADSVDCDGNPYHVIRVPITSYESNGFYVPKTYLNSLIINNKVIVPIFNQPEDEQALEIYRNAMPGYDVAGVNVTSIYMYGGSIHCTTKGIPRIPLSIGLSTDKENYNTGEYVRVSLSAHAPAESITCDLYIKVRSPTGGDVFYPEWDSVEKPVFSDLILPKDLELYTIELFEWKIEPGEKPLSDPGTYQITAYMTEPGTDLLIGTSHTAEIEIVTNCPNGMIFVKDSSIWMASDYKVDLSEYCIDKYEYPNMKGEKPEANYSWYEALAVCEDSGKRLCTEAEWENTCKGSSSYDYPYGWMHKNGFCPDYTRGVQPSGSYPLCSGIHDVYDMSGNLWEWVNDWLGEYPEGTHDNPQGPDIGFYKVMRGGDTWGAVWEESSCTSRGNQYPKFSGSMLGFRCCADKE